MDFAIPVDDRGKIKGDGMIDKYLNTKGLWNIKVMVKPVGVLGTVLKCWKKKIGEIGNQTIQFC